MGYAIEKNVPVPTGVVRSSGENKYRWAEMSEGDSIFVPLSDAEEGLPIEKFRSRIYNAARKFGRDNGVKFLALVVTETKPNPNWDPRPGSIGETEAQQVPLQGVRVWHQGPAKAASPNEE